jgi:SAM-dependent methyltransferase
VAGAEQPGFGFPARAPLLWLFTRMPTWNELHALPTTTPAPEEPEPFVVRALDALPAPRSTSVLDVGCGAGRHLVWLARQGFVACGVDSAARDLALARALLQREGHPVRVARADMRELPFADAGFGALIAHHALHHASRDDMSRALAEVSRVLRDEGLFAGTLLSTRTWRQGEGWRLERGTYVQERGPEAGVVHHYCDEADARDLLMGFDVDSLALDEHSDDDGHRHSHWQFVAVRRRRPR